MSLTELPQKELKSNDEKNLFNRLVKTNEPFACIYRPLSDAKDSFLLFEGKIKYTHSISELEPISLEPTLSSKPDDFDTIDITISGELDASQLIIIPFNQISEKGFACHNDNEPVIIMSVEKQTRYQIKNWGFIENSKPIKSTNIHFDITDQDYRQMVEHVINDEINAGEGSNFVISRSLEGDIEDFSLENALSLFNRLLINECGSYWTWIVYTGDRYLIGSSPEQHILVDGEDVTMNPISGTLKYPEKRIEQALYHFINNKKEQNELFMVVDEELKMMSRICDSDITVTGPQLKMMSQVAHTEYFIRGSTSQTIQTILKESLFAPTVTGSPVENASQVIKRWENRGRGYYSGVIGMIGVKNNQRYLDSAILIRAADIMKNGHFRLTSGATIVRDSVSENEAEETKAKLSGLMSSFFDEKKNVNTTNNLHLSEHVLSNIATKLRQRNHKASSFWLGNSKKIALTANSLPSITLIDMEDSFTEMIAHQLRYIGHDVTIVSWFKSGIHLPQLMNTGKTDILFIGPGPGDPNSVNHDKMVTGRTLITNRLKQNLPLIGTCLGHQLICAEFGLPIRRLSKTRQGIQYKIAIESMAHHVGFYNSFAAMHKLPHWFTPKYNRLVYLERLGKNEIIALKSNNVASIQFHNESFLTTDAFPIYNWMINNAIGYADKGLKINKL
ncbi:chorismate-binding protein [Xenorhabdus hominickii]|uniref:anthranilate synthase n=2 Tax=Xenorhabdus hominickii TaxID=351679 RepID=A0A2G0Q9V8_XENHO|nr:chorismate-binding protein [Xenorhabdus hominickii]AOM41020.1 phenazine-specific anthranilate synthase [Xenorhabdus hominickii]PHM56002.1 phenazine biosynthesis protein PhzE [Xenorhabdus hominickii]